MFAEEAAWPSRIDGPVGELLFAKVTLVKLQVEG